MKKILTTILTITTIMGLCACGNSAESANSASADAASGEAELTEITFCLDWTPNTNHTGIYVADALGYFEDAGIKVNIVQPPEDGAELMCASGQAQFAVSAQDTIAAAFDSDEPLEVTCVATLLQHNTSGIISRAGDGIDTPAGLEGKTYSTWQSPIEIAMLENVMQADGADFSKVTLIPNDITDEAAALSANQTDAVWVFYGWSGINAELSGVETDYWNFSDINEIFDYYTPMLIANNEFLEENPEVAKAFLAAAAKGYEYAIENPQEAADMLIEGDTTGSLVGSEELVYASQKWVNEQYVSDAPYWGYITPERWDDFYSWLYENSLTERDLSGQFYSNEYLSE